MKNIKIGIVTLLVVLMFSFVGEKSYATEGMSFPSEPIYGINNYEKVYINERGILPLSKGDLVRIDGEYNGYYYTITGTENYFFIPRDRLTVGVEVDKKLTSEYIKKNLDRQSKIAQVVGFAYLQLGKPYIWGGNGDVGFDCSGITSSAYGSIGIKIPRTSIAQSMHGTKVESSNLSVGDLIFFKGSEGYVNHVGMYVGEGKFLHASTSGDVVKMGSLINSYYTNKLVMARRIIN